MKITLTLLLCLGLVGCAIAANSQRINRVNLGMTKAEVIKTMGMPSSSKAKENIEVLEYMLYDTGNDAMFGMATPYWITLRNDKVVEYGKAGDFGSSAPQD